MNTAKGKIVLMGSGELTATMVEVHKELLTSMPSGSKAVFLDTPAGFQLNVDQISERAVDYFNTRVNHPISVASFKSSQNADVFASETTFQLLRNAGFILIGPGSPTYTVRQLKSTPIPKIFTQNIVAGGCLVAASAAALTVGRYTLPVYEIYKVGADLHWIDGLDLLGVFGFNLIVIPHWNNAEGGTHDTSCCFMGQSRFARLMELIPEDVAVLGLDEHTACIIDLAKQEVTVRGIGMVRWRHKDREFTMGRNDQIPLDAFAGGRFEAEKIKQRQLEEPLPTQSGADKDDSFWKRIHALDADFKAGIEQRSHELVTRALLELDRAIWNGLKARENEESIAQAREILRDHVVALGACLADAPMDEKVCIERLVEEMLQLRNRFRKNEQWGEADGIREILERVNVMLEDWPGGTHWHLAK